MTGTKAERADSTIPPRHPTAAAVVGTEILTGLRIQRNGILLVVGLMLAVVALAAAGLYQAEAEMAALGPDQLPGADRTSELRIGGAIGVFVLVGLLWPFVVWRHEPPHRRSSLYVQPGDRRLTTAARVVSGAIGLLGLMIVAMGVQEIIVAMTRAMIGEYLGDALTVDTSVPGAVFAGAAITYLLGTSFAVAFRRPGIALLGGAVAYYFTWVFSAVLGQVSSPFEAIAAFLGGVVRSLVFAAGGLAGPDWSLFGVTMAEAGWTPFAAGWLLVTLGAATALVLRFRESEA